MRIVPTAAASDDGEFATNNPVSAAAAAAALRRWRRRSRGQPPQLGGSRALDALVETIDMQLGGGMLSGALADAAAGVGGGRGSPRLRPAHVGPSSAAWRRRRHGRRSMGVARRRVGRGGEDTLVGLTVPTPSPPPSPPGEGAPGTAPLVGAAPLDP